MAMSNEELEQWAEYGTGIQPLDHPSYGYAWGEDIVNLWRVVGEIAQRHLDGLPEPVEPEPPMDLV